MESNNSTSTPSFSRNTATASSSDPPPPNQRNDDKGKQTCSNVSEATNNDNRSEKLGPSNYSRPQFSKFVGVKRQGATKNGYRWQANVCKDGKKHYLGTFGTEEAAARAYDIAALRLWGPTGSKKLNFDLKNYNVKKILKCSNIPFKELEWERFVKNEEFGVVPDEFFDGLRFPPYGFFDAESEFRLRNGVHYNYTIEPLIKDLMNDDVKDYTDEIYWSSDDDKPQEPAGGSNQNK